jgi:hypothetical protein
MKPEDKRIIMEKEGWRIHQKWFWLDRIVMVRTGLIKKPEYATIFPNGKIKYGDHGPVDNHSENKSTIQYPM